ncbi:TPR domain protein [Rivularia sp. IAM M-261]|nr:TPR domain protein [Rivularia sp. IAM M-261]
MSNHLKNFALVTLVFSLTCGVGIAANDVAIKQTLAQTATSSDKKVEADKLFQEGVQQFRRGEYPKALQTYQRVLEIRRQLGDKAGEAAALNKLGEVYNGLNQPTQALEVLQQSVNIYKVIADKAAIGEVLDNIGTSYRLKLDAAKALEFYQQALTIRREIKDRQGEGKTLSNIGLTYNNQKQYPKALETLQQALAIHKEVQDRYWEGYTLIRIGIAYGDSREYKRELEYYQQSLTLNRELGNKDGEFRSLLNIGWHYNDKKDYVNAVYFWQQSLVAMQIVQNKTLKAITIKNIADAYYAQKQYDKAIEFYQQALPIVREVKDKSQETIILIDIGQIFFKQEKYERALEFYKQALPLANKNSEQEASILVLIGVPYFMQGKYDLAIENFQKSLIIAKEIKNSTIEAQNLAGIAESYNAHKKFDKAIEFFQQALALQQKPLNNRSAQLTILMRIMSIYYVNASDASLQKDYSRGMMQANESLKLVPEALKVARELKNSKVEKEILEIQSKSYSLIGNYHFQLRELEKAEKFIQQGLNIAWQSENLDAERYALSFLAGVYKDQGNIRKVIELGQRELEIAQKLRDTAFEAQALSRIANIYAVLGDFDKAIQFSQQALSKSNEIDIQKLPKYSQNHAYYQKLSALGLLSLIYTSIGEYDKAFEYAQQRLQFARTLKNPEFEASALIAFGDVYENTQEFQKSIEFTQQALAIIKGVKNYELEAEALKQLSTTYTGKGDYLQALESAQQILPIAEKTNNFKLKINAFDIQRKIYTNQGNYQKVIELFQKALSIAKQNSDLYSEWSNLLEIGLFYKTLGDEQKSSEYLQQALSLAQKIKNPEYEGTSLFIIGYTYFGKDQPEKIIEYANRGLGILSKTKMVSTEIMGNMVLALGYGELNNEQKAMEAAQASLEIVRKSRDASVEKQVLTVIGSLQRKFGKNKEAIQTYNQALAIKTQAQAVGADSSIYAGLGRAYTDLNQPNVAITYYKEAINRIEEVRSGIKVLTPDLQASFLQSTVDFGKVKTSDIYRQYANVLLSQGRNVEAEQVLELLKLQELSEYTTGARGTTDKKPVGQTPTEERIIKKYGSLIAFGQKVDECSQKKCPLQRELNDERDALISEYNQQIKNLTKNVLSRLSQDSAVLNTQDLPRLSDRIVKSQDSTVMINVFVVGDKTWLMWASKGGILKSVEIPVGETKLRSKVENFRKLLQNPGSDIIKVQATGKEIYDWLIKPIEPELKANKIQNLVFALDRSARYIPISALYDGKQYLIENYTVTTVLSAGLTDTEKRLPPGTKNTSVLGLGLSQAVPGFSALPNVGKEIDFIIRAPENDNKGIYPGNKFLNKDFGYEALRDNLIGHNILHIATHGEFVSGSQNNSFLVLGTGDKLAINQIETLQDLGYIHLVVLSACETALGETNKQDGIEIPGISFYFLNQGAKSVISSLWKVDDPSTAQLMQKFYSNLATDKHPTKAAALRQAQLSLLNGNNSTSRNPKIRGITVNIKPGASSRNEKPQSGYSHPYYWAPFILIGNGL